MSLGFTNTMPQMMSRATTIEVETQRERTTIAMPANLQRILIGLNGAAAAMHLVFAAITLIFGTWDFSVPLYAYNVSTHATNDTFTVHPSVVESTATLHLMWATASFFLISCAAHLGNGFLWRKFYLTQLKHCLCPTRWLEYAFSAPLMALMIAYLSGVVMQTELFLIFALVMTTMFFGHVQELSCRVQSADKWEISSPLARLQPWFLGNVPQVAAWLVIVTRFFSLADSAPEMPTFVYYIVFVELGLFFSFGFVQLVVYLSPPKRYIAGEVTYQALSLISKGTLGVLMTSSVLWRESADDIYTM